MASQIKPVFPHVAIRAEFKEDMDWDKSVREIMREWGNAIHLTRVGRPIAAYKGNITIIQIPPNDVYKSSVRSSTCKNAGYTKRQFRRKRHTFYWYKVYGAYPATIKTSELEGSFNVKFEYDYDYAKYTVSKQVA